MKISYDTPLAQTLRRLNRTIVLSAFLAMLIAPMMAQTDRQAKFQEMVSAHEARGAIVASVLSGESTARQALAQLKGRSRKASITLDDDGDLGSAALDIGRRLLSAGDPKSAELFFLEAQKAYQKGVGRQDINEQRRALYHEKLAAIQSSYLGNPQGAKANIETALRLDPESRRLEKAYDRLAERHPDVIKPQQRKPRG